MRPKEELDKIRLNHKLLLKRLRAQVKNLMLSKYYVGNYYKIRMGIKRRLKAIQFIVTSNRIIKMTELKDKFKINIYDRRLEL